MSNIDPGITIDNMTTNVIVKIDPSTMFVYAKIAGRVPNVGYVSINGNKVTINSTDFTRIYPQ